jgi:hypothetical protein
VSRKGHVRLFLDSGNCICYAIGSKPATEQMPQGFRWAEMLDGITERNISEVVAALTKDGLHVTLYRVDKAEYFAHHETEGKCWCKSCQ